MAARITLNELVKARARLDQKPKHKTVKELEGDMITIKSGQRGGKSLDNANQISDFLERPQVVNPFIPTVKKEPNYSQVVKSVGTTPANTVVITKVHKPLGFINKSNMIRFVIPVVAGICLGSMLQGLFAGSCTTAVACIKTGRNFICIDKEPQYCEIGEKRIAALPNTKLDKWF